MTRTPSGKYRAPKTPVPAVFPGPARDGGAPDIDIEIATPVPMDSPRPPDEHALELDRSGTNLEGLPPEKQWQLRREARLQLIGKQLVSNLYMLIRNVKIHAPDNQIFLKPIEALRENMNTAIALDKQLALQAVGTSVYINGLQLKFDFAALENVRSLTRELEQRDIGGFSASHPLTTQEIRDFLAQFSGDNEAEFPDKENGATSSIELARFKSVKELLDKLQADLWLDRQIDKKKYLMVVYSRSVLFMTRFYDRISSSDFSIPYAQAGRLIQDLVDLCRDERSYFLGVTTSRSEDQYWPFHAVNTALLSIVFGHELKLDKRQLHDLGMAALFSQIGLATMPGEMMNRPGPLTAQERAEIAHSSLRTAKAILVSRGLDLSTMQRMLAAYESKINFGRIDKSGGEKRIAKADLGPGMYGKIISIAEVYDALTSRRPFREAYGPEIAMALMEGELEHKFDPVLIRVFRKVMAIQPTKILDQSQSTLRIGGWES